MTKEEIEAAIAANPEVQNVLTEVLKGKGLNILTPEDHNKFVEQERERIAREKTSEIYSNLDKDLSEVAGFGKEGNEKTYDYAKRAVTTYKTKADQLSQQIATLQEEIKTKGADPVLKAKLEALEKENEDLKTGLSAKDKAIFEREIANEINIGLAALKPKAELPEYLVKMAIETEKANLIANAERTENGQIIYKDAKGAPILNDKREPADATWILADRLKDIIDTGRKQTGVGTGDQGSGNGTGGKVLPEGLKTKVEVTEALKKMGVLSGTQDFDKLYNEYLEKHPNLPLR